MSRNSTSESEEALPTPPERGDPDRKRVLNILAQRRYRQRKRERLAALESLATDPFASSATAELSDGVAKAPASNASSCGQSLEPGILLSDGARNYSDDARNFGAFDPSFQRFGGGISLPDLVSSDAAAAWGDITLFDLDMLDMEYDETRLLEEGALITGPGLSLPCSSPSVNVTSSNLDATSDLMLQMPGLKTLKVGLTIMQLLGCVDMMWDLNAKWTLDGKDVTMLPRNLQPTEAQLRVPHHPLLDFLPWPVLRTKLILMFALPSNLRPPIARDPESIMHIANDIDDPSGGFIVNGPNGMNDSDWEIGETFLKNWWWAIDRGIIEHTNASRARRGVERLRLEG